MNSKLENKFSMFNAVKSVRKQNQTAVDSVPAVKTCFLKFDNKFSEIENAIKLQIKSIKGYASVKSDLTASLCESANLLSSALFAYASLTNNKLIKDSSNYSHSEFTRMRDTILVETCRNLHALASANLTVLTPYNIDANFLTDFNDLIVETDNINPAPVVERSHRKAYTSQLRVLFKEMMLFITDELDKTMLLLKKTHPDFYLHYKNSRIIVDLKGKRNNSETVEPLSNAALFGFVYNENTNAPVEDTVIEIPALNITVTSDEDGEYYIDNVPKGVHTLRISAVSFNQKELPGISIADNEQLPLDIYITPSDLPSESETIS